MSAVEIYDATIESLGRGDRIAALQELKRRSVALAQGLEHHLAARPAAGTSPEQQRDELLEALTEPAEELLAAALPLIEYGVADDHAAIAQAVQHVVDRVAAAERAPNIAKISATVVIGRIFWAMAVYALSCRRIDGLVALAGVGTVTRYDEEPMLPIVDDREYRYPQALGRVASSSFYDYGEWLSARELVTERLPYLAASVDETLSETDLLLALRMQASLRSRTYSSGKRSSTVRKLALRFRDPRQRRHLIELFGVADADLDERVDHVYAQVEWDQSLMAPGPPARMLVRQP